MLNILQLDVFITERAELNLCSYSLIKTDLHNKIWTYSALFGRQIRFNYCREEENKHRQPKRALRGRTAELILLCSQVEVEVGKPTETYRCPCIFGRLAEKQQSDWSKSLTNHRRSIDAFAETTCSRHIALLVTVVPSQGRSRGWFAVLCQAAL